MDQARSEAAHALRLLKGTAPTLPVFIDLEEPRTQVLGGEMITQIANTFCTILEQNGYKSGVYASLSWWEYYFQDWFTSNPSYYHWIAHWSSSCGYDGRYEAWQYSNSGSIRGINGRVDLNYWYGTSLNVYDNRYDEARYAAVYDYDYYVNRYSDLAGMSRIQAIRHFVDYGMQQGRIASESFSPYIYRGKYLDLYYAYENDLSQYYLHYINTGYKEGRTAAITEPFYPVTVYKGIDYSSVYNYWYYTEMNGDIAAYANGNDYIALQHFAVTGTSEGRIASETFSPYIYRGKYLDLYYAYENELPRYYQHYIDTGSKEGRTAASTEPLYPLTVYKGVDYSPVYDYWYYIRVNGDVAAYACGNDYIALQHFVVNGTSEGRIASESFSPYIYRKKYGDLSNAYGEHLERYYQHYLDTGISEGRTAGLYETY